MLFYFVFRFPALPPSDSLEGKLAKSTDDKTVDQFVSPDRTVFVPALVRDLSPAKFRSYAAARARLQGAAADRF